MPALRDVAQFADAEAARALAGARARGLKASPLDGIEGLGKRRHGKPQLRIDEARKWTATALELADKGTWGRSWRWWWSCWGWGAASSS